MILSKRSFAWRDVVVRRWLVRHPSFLVKVVESRGVVSEDRLWETARLWSVVPEWPCVGVPLSGHGVMRNAGSSAEMRRGHVGLVGRGADFRARTEAAPAFGVFVQWDPEVFGGATSVSLDRAVIGPRELARVATALRAITREGATHDVLAANVGELFRVFGSLGVIDARAPVDLRAPPPRLVSVGHAIDGVLSRSGTRPMVVDLTRALDCSERQARYLVREYVGAYALQGATEWRTLVNVWTTYLAGLLMTSRGATTERVASLLGYGSPNAFCHALTNAGLPSPGEMRRIVADLA
jgi:hypothetical protein